MCGLKCMLSSEKWAEMSAPIAFDLLQFMHVSHILICVVLTSLDFHWHSTPQATLGALRQAIHTQREGMGERGAVETVEQEDSH